MNKILKESILLILVVLPLVYLASIWSELPEIVPTHFDFHGVTDGWSHKSSLIIMACCMGYGIYLLMLIIPFLDPKKKIMQMGEKYYNLRFIFTFPFALLTTYLIYIGKAGSIKNPNSHLIFIGSLLAMLGNYLKTIRPNYFIGIRSPWTLESENTWKKTHKLAGPIWMVGGILLASLAFIFPVPDTLLNTLFLIIILTMVFVPFIYSYLVYRKEG